MQLVDKPRRAVHILAALFSAVLAAGTLVSAVPALAAETVGGGSVLENASKTATELDGNLESKVTLSFPGKQQTASSDVVFVIDKSGFSDAEQIYKQAEQFLSEIKDAAVSKGLSVKVAVVLFNYQGNVQIGLTDVVSGYDDILTALKSEVKHRTNMHAGLLAAKSVLDADTAVAAQNKHVILISDGATYMYCKDGDYTKGYTRSFGSGAGWSDGEGGIYEVDRRNNQSPNPTPKTYTKNGKNFFMFNAEDTDMLGEYIEYYRKLEENGNYSQYDYAYDPDAESSSAPADKVLPMDFNTPANLDLAFAYADDVFQEMYESGYDMNVYYKNKASWPYGELFMKYLARNSNNGQLNTDFEELKAQITDMVSNGSYLVDYIGENFDFVNDIDKISLSVNGEELTKTKVGSTGDNTTCYMFGFKDGSQRFDLTYDPDEDKLTLNIYESIAPAQPVTLTYYVALVNKPTAAGTYNLATNKSATLYPVASDGSKGPEVTFDVPYVTYTVPGTNPGTNPGGSPDAGTGQPAAAKATTRKVPKTGDVSSIAPAVAAAVAGAGACAAALGIKRRR